MRGLIGFLIVSSVVLSSPAVAQNTAESCSTMVGIPGVAIYVDSLSVEMIDKGMTETVFAVEIERILLESGIPVLHPEVKEKDQNVPGNPVLYVGITTVFQFGDTQCLYGIRVEFTQTVRLERNPGYVVEHVPTWSVGGIGIYQTGWRDALIDDVLGFTEQFIVAFYEANPLLKPEPGDSTKTEGFKYDALD